MSIIGRTTYRGFLIEVSFLDDEKYCEISRESDSEIIHRSYYRFNADASMILDSAQHKIDTDILPKEFAVQQE